MKWVKAYYIGTDEIVQRPISDEKAEELRKQEFPDVAISSDAWPFVPILLNHNGSLTIYRANKN